MLKEIVINSNFQHLGSLLESDIPEGISVVPSGASVIERRNLDFNVVVNVDVKLIIDVGKISSVVAAIWLAKKFAKNRKFKIGVNGNAIPENEAETIKLIKQEIEKQK